MNKRMKLSGMIWAGLSMVLAGSPMLSQAEIIKSKTIDNGSSGPYKAVAVTESSLEDCVVYRPVDMDAAVAKEGKLPVLVWANGGCMDSSINHERVLSEIASHGYVIVAIGTLQMTPNERPHRPTPDDKLLELVDWISEQSKDSGSDYYNNVDLEKIAAGGQSCGGAQTMRVAGDPRIKTCLMYNTGMGEMSMAGASKESLKTVHGPVVYIVGGPTDVAYANALVDYDNLEKVPVAFANLEHGGHMGTFAEEFGGSFSRMGLAWLDWQFKGKTERSSIFLTNDLEEFPGWTMKAKHFDGASAAVAASPESVEIRITRDIAYREGDSDAWKLDMAMPAAPADGLRPALVIVHGGGWGAGDKSDQVYQTMMEEYAKLGYVTINVNYRLTREAEFPACIEDVKCAVRWLRAHADEYNVDPDRIGSYGHSAGAHLSLMLAMAPKSAGLEGDGGWDDYSSMVNVAAGGSPPTELGRGGPMASSEWWPIDYIGADHPPLFLIQGLQDRVVRPELTTDFVEKMKAAGADIKYLTLDGHHGVAFDLHLDVTKPALEEFFAEHLNPSSPAAKVEAAVEKDVKINITRDITYREGDSGAWKLDMAMPAAPADGLRPALVIVHGGGWAAGDKSDQVYQTMMEEYAKLGYVTINVNYRLTREAEFPACIEDVKCAVRWLRAHADEYKVDPDRIGSYGHSAGAHLSLMLAMAPKSAGLEGDGGWDDYSSMVNVAAGGSPPTERRGSNEKEWWPIGYIGKDHPPLFLLQGLQDPIVRPELTTDFVEKMKAAGADIKYMTIEGDHDIAYSDHLDVTKPALEAFFAEHLKPGSSSAKKKAAEVTVENGGTGPFSAIATEDASLPGMTIFRPRDLSVFGGEEKLPVMLWGNGACANTTFEHKNFLNEIASHGYIILAIGPLDQMNQRGAASREPTTPDQLIAALDWMEKQCEKTDTIYAGRVDMDRVAVLGMSCGGLQAIAVADDPRLSTVVVCNSGVLPEPSPLAGMPPLTKEALNNFHTPVLYIIGGPSDIAFDNAMDDFNRVNHVPIIMSNFDVGHGGTYAQPHGGEFTRVALAWLNWQLKGEAEAKAMFLDDDSELNTDPKWIIETRNFEG